MFLNETATVCRQSCTAVTGKCHQSRNSRYSQTHTTAMCTVAKCPAANTHSPAAMCNDTSHTPSLCTCTKPQVLPPMCPPTCPVMHRRYVLCQRSCTVATSHQSSQLLCAMPHIIMHRRVAPHAHPLQYVPCHQSRTAAMCHDWYNPSRHVPCHQSRTAMPPVMPSRCCPCHAHPLCVMPPVMSGR